MPEVRVMARAPRVPWVRKSAAAREDRVLRRSAASGGYGGRQADGTELRRSAASVGGPMPQTSVSQSAYSSIAP